MRKVGACLNKKEILKMVIENNGGIARTSDFAANGINKYEVAAFCKEGVIERIRRGFYQLPQSKNITEEHKNKIIEANRKQIYCIDLDKIFNSITEASKELEIDASSITRCCQGKYKQIKGYHFKYLNI